MDFRRILLAVAVVGCLAVLIFVVKPGVEYARLPGKIRSEARNFDAGMGYELLGSVSEGTTFCIMSCREFRVVQVWSSNVSQVEMCRHISTQLAQKYGEVKFRDPLDPCTASAEMSNVFSGAYVVLGAVGPVDAGEFDFLDESFFDGGESGVRVSFSSGVD